MKVEAAAEAKKASAEAEAKTAAKAKRAKPPPRPKANPKGEPPRLVETYGFGADEVPAWAARGWKGFDMRLQLKGLNAYAAMRSAMREAGFSPTPGGSEDDFDEDESDDGAERAPGVDGFAVPAVGVGNSVV